MAALQQVQQLSGPHCVLLGVQYASESNIAGLRALTALRENDLPLELVLGIILTYLPEELDPSSYLEYLSELATSARRPGEDPATALDIAAVEELSNSRAKKRRRVLELVPVVHPLYAAEAELDIFSHFLLHRAHRIDAQTGLLDIIPNLIVPFFGQSEYLRTWFISTVLPLARLGYEYYPQGVTPTLDEFARLKGTRAIQTQLSNVQHLRGTDTQHVARDLRGVVAPWMCGASDRKRRKLTTEGRRASVVQDQVPELDDWGCLFQWLMRTSKDNLELATAAMTGWDGPADTDLGGHDDGRVYVDAERQHQLQVRYAQTALACLYLIDKSDIPSLHLAHSLLGRICQLQSYDPPPDFNIGVDSLPSYKPINIRLHSATVSALREERLLDPDNAMTNPDQESAGILGHVILSACLFSNLEHALSLREVAMIQLRRDHAEQFSLLQKILYTLSSTSKRNSDQWKVTRDKLLWLQTWTKGKSHDENDVQGVFGKLHGRTIEIEILRALIESNHFPLAIQIYVKPTSGKGPLPPSDVERVVLTSAINYYDNASNGNRTRGGMKRAADIVHAFAPHFTTSSRFSRTQALFAATHAMSFYSLILEHGVPFQPVNIRVSSNPLSLIRKLLSQNPGSYTKLDDLISIGQNLVIAMPSTIMDEDSRTVSFDATALDRKKAAAQRRVTGMAIQGALEEDDFETAYSYVVNRLTPHTPSTTPSVSSQLFSFGSTEPDDAEDDAEDVAWRAALRAGRFSSPSNSWSKAGNTARPDLRRLEQRMELLSQALLLAPPSHLEEVLGVWQQCEAEMTHLLAQETEAEERFNDAADRRIPGTFDFEPITVQPLRREIGRGAVEEAPMGLFDVARGAAAAFSKSAFPLRGNAQAAANTEPRNSFGASSRVSMDMSDSASIGGHDERVRKRDLVANAATGALASGSGALASGLGWMLGAKPVTEREHE